MNYKYNIVINQKAIVDNGLAIDIVDAAVFDFIKDFSHSDKCVKMQIDGKTYFWITNQTIIDNLPLLQITTARGLRKRIDNLINAGLLVRNENSQELNKTLYTFGSKYDSYIFYSEPRNESSTLGTVVPTPRNSCSHDNNNKNNNITTTESASAHTCMREGIERVREWICDNEDAVLILLKRCNLIQGLVTPEYAKKLLEPYIQAFYEQLIVVGKEDINAIGRLGIKSHFQAFLPKYIRKQELEQQQKQKEYEQGVDPITRAMQDFEAGWNYAASRKEQEQSFECF
jgi:hypothetical protein